MMKIPSVPLLQWFPNTIREVIKNSSSPDYITPDNILQWGNKKQLHLVYQILDTLMLEGSEILHAEHIKQLYSLSRKGKSVLILMEHYGSMDLPIIHKLLSEKYDEAEMTQRIFAIASLKLNEQHIMIRGLSEGFNRLIIYPGRLLERFLSKETDVTKIQTEVKRRQSINLSSMRLLRRLKYQQHPVLIFPWGTRHRPDQPNTKQVLPEVDAYLRLFDYMVFVSIKGDILKLDSDSMSVDLPQYNVCILNASPVYSCKEFRQTIIDNLAPEKKEDPTLIKDTVSQVMDKELKELHDSSLPIFEQKMRNIRIPPPPELYLSDLCID